MPMDRLEDVTRITSRDWLYAAGSGTEDGTVVEGVAYFLLAETPDGFRFQHDHNFCTGYVNVQEDGFQMWSHQDRKQDEATIEAYIAKVQAHVDAGNKLDSNHWYPVQGCYGSGAWDSQAEYERERQEENEGPWR